jgi:hypothetical protein
MITTIDIAWAAGIYEGEGTCNYRGDTVSIAQKNRWILDKLQSLFGGKVHNYLEQNNAHYWRIHGPHARGFLLTIFTFMSPRRRKQIRTEIDFQRLPYQTTKNTTERGIRINLRKAGFTEDKINEIILGLQE